MSADDEVKDELLCATRAYEYKLVGNGEIHPVRQRLECYYNAKTKNYYLLLRSAVGKKNDGAIIWQEGAIPFRTDLFPNPYGPYALQALAIYDKMGRAMKDYRLISQADESVFTTTAPHYTSDVVNARLRKISIARTKAKKRDKGYDV